MVEIRAFSPFNERDCIEALMVGHWREVESIHVKRPPTPLWHVYEAMEEQDRVVAFAAYDNSEMVGYVIVFMAEHIHYGFVYGQHDVIYVKPGYRKSSIGLKLIRLAEQETNQRGASILYWHAKHGSTFASIMEKTKHRNEEEIFVKEF